MFFTSIMRSHMAYASSRPLVVGLVAKCYALFICTLLFTTYLLKQCSRRWPDSTTICDVSLFQCTPRCTFCWPLLNRFE